MKHIILSGCAVLVTALGITLIAAQAKTPPPLGTLGVEAQLAVAPAPLRVETDDDRLIPLAAYVEKAMRTWAPPDSLSADYEEIAVQIAVTALDEEPVWDWDTTRARTAILLASLAFWESRFRAYVDSGACNEKGFAKHSKLAYLGTCDGGWAHSIWQIHPMRLCTSKDTSGYCVYTDVTGAKLGDRAYAAKTALWLARRSIRGGAGLTGYTGETEGFSKARVRLAFALDYSRRHPYTAR
jgi:hypothetical protein